VRAGLRGRSGRLVLGALALAAFLAPGATAHACTRTWAGGTGDWTTAANWVPAGVPGATDDVCVPPGASSVVTLAVGDAGPVAIRSLVVGGEGPGPATLTIGDARLTTSDGGTIGANGTLVLAATATGGATLDGATITNHGSIVARSKPVNGGSNRLRTSVVNEPTGTLNVASGQLVTDDGSTFENLGTVVAASPGTWSISTDPALSSTPTQIINSGHITTYITDTAATAITATDATWTQAGGTNDGGVRIESGLLDYQAGIGAFALGTGQGDVPPQLAGTIPPNQTVGVVGSLRLVGPVVTNDGALQVSPFSYGPYADAIPLVLDGSVLDNAGQLTFLLSYADSLTGTVNLRTDVRNEGVLSIGKIQLVQDSGTELDSSGLLDISPVGRYDLSAAPTASRPSTFVNVAPGIVAFELARHSSGQIQLGPGSTMTAAGGIAAPPQSFLTAQAQSFLTAQGNTYSVITSTGGTLTGAFTSGVDGFRMLQGPNTLSIAFGQVATNGTGGRRAISLTDACPPGTKGCYLIVRATTKARVSQWVGKGVRRRRRTHVASIVVVNAGVSLAPGVTRAITLPLNARGRALAAHPRHALTVVVTAISDTRTILRRTVRVRP
jgi:hypothetical protein